MTPKHNRQKLKQLDGLTSPSFPSPDRRGSIRYATLLIGGFLVTAPAPLGAQELDEQRLAVRDLSFAGNRAIDDLMLRASIATTEGSCGIPLLGCLFGLGETRYLDEREFRRDVLRLRTLYNQSGFPDAQVDTLVHRADGSVRIQFLIHEGEPIRVTEVEISGSEGIVPPAALREAIPLRVGAPFNRFLLQRSADTLRVAFQDRGYPWAQVFLRFDEDREALEARVGFEIAPGSRATIRAVEVTGSASVSDATMLRMVPVREGRVYSRRELLDSQRALYAMDLFNYVNVVLADSVPSNGDSSVAVRIQVSEADLHRVRLGVGFGSVDCLRGLAGWSARNFLGGGRRLDLTAQVSKLGLGDPADLGLERSICFGIPDDEDPERLELNFTLSASLTEPFLFSRRTSATVSITAERRSEISAYVRESVGGDLGLRRVFAGVPVTLTYALTRGRTRAQPAIFCSLLNVCREEDTRIFTDYRFQSTIALRAIRDRRDIALDPSRGSLVTVEARWASTLIGSDSLAQFARLVGEVATYHRLGRRTIFAWRVRGGTIFPPTLDIGASTTEFVPPDERFYAGGPNSVRGFGQNQLGPVVRVQDGELVDTDGDGVVETFRADTLVSPTGGNHLIFANAELRVPISGRVRGALFVDVGQVFGEEDESFDLSALRVTPGAGLRIGSPLGPIRFDVAYNPYGPRPGPVYRRQGNLLHPSLPLPPGESAGGLFDRLRFHFSIGQAF